MKNNYLLYFFKLQKLKQLKLVMFFVIIIINKVKIN